MRYFKDYQSYIDSEIDFRLEQVNENTVSDFIDFIISKVKAAPSVEAARKMVERILLKAYNVNKKILPALLSALLMVMPLNSIISGSKDMNADAKEFFEKIIREEAIKKQLELEKKEKEIEDLRINSIVPEFYDSLARHESRGDWTVSNGLGYIGKYQIGALAFLETYDIVKVKYLKKLPGNRRTKVDTLISEFNQISKDKSLSKEEKEEKLDKIFPLEEQEKVMRAVIAKNEIYLKKYKKYVGIEINGIKVTWSGLLAAAHLMGAKSVKTYLDSNGKDIPQDKFGTTVETYMKMFI